MPDAIATVLVVDDDCLVRDAARIILENNGYAVSEAPEGETALASLAANRADIVLLDILMPRKEGLETLIELKRRFPDVTVYAMSASGARKGHDFLSIAAKFGAHGYCRSHFRPTSFSRSFVPILCRAARGHGRLRRHLAGASSWPMRPHPIASAGKIYLLGISPGSRSASDRSGSAWRSMCRCFSKPPSAAH